MKPEHVAVLPDGEKIYFNKQVVVGYAGEDEVQYGFVLEDLDDGYFGCDLFFRDLEFADGHDTFAYVWMEETDVPDTWGDTPQAAVDIALETLQRWIVAYICACETSNSSGADKKYILAVVEEAYTRGAADEYCY